jgi:low temperature requirement protein LtrA
VTTDYDIEGGHFAERCRLFIIIALGESIVVTGATAAQAGLTPTMMACLVMAFLETVALCWLYFGAPTEHSHAAVTASDDRVRLARDAYTYVHLLTIAGIIATAAGDGLLIAEPHFVRHGIGPTIVLGGPALFLLVEILFEWRTTGRANVKPLTAAGVIIGLVPLGTQVSALVLATMVTALLSALAVWELRARRHSPGRPQHHGWRETCRLPSDPRAGGGSEPATSSLGRLALYQLSNRG